MTTDAHPPTIATSDTDSLKPRIVYGNIDEYQPNTTSSWPNSTSGWLHNNVAPGCTATLISRSTAITAAHCVYNNGWYPTPFVAFGAQNYYAGQAYAIKPFGEYLPSSITIPNAWISGGQSLYDYAVVEFSPSYPGDYTGWLGAQQNNNISRSNYYHGDFAQWSSNALYSYGAVNSGGFIRHQIDVFSSQGSASGAAFYDANSRVNSFFIREDYATSPSKNVNRAWDGAVYNFFHTYGQGI